MMHRIRKSYVIAGMLIIIISACKKTSSTPANGGAATVSFTINGDGYVNQNITISSAGTNPESAAVYFNKWDFTRGSIDDRVSATTEDKNRFSLYIDGKKTGQQTLGTDFANTAGPFTYVSILLDLTGKDGTKRDYVYQDNTFSGDPLPPGSTISITKYGAVNDSIEGDFEGALFNTDNQQIITITNGHFKIPRGGDIK
jgi:hypothetical protein